MPHIPSFQKTPHSALYTGKPTWYPIEQWLGRRGIMTEQAYQNIQFRASEMQHEYGPNVHILSDPFALTQLARLCSEGTVVPEVSHLERSLYTHMLRVVVNQEFPRKTVSSPTRMASLVPGASYEGEVIAPETRVTSVDIARAGILPRVRCASMNSAR